MRAKWKCIFQQEKLHFLGEHPDKSTKTGKAILFLLPVSFHPLPFRDLLLLLPGFVTTERNLIGPGIQCNLQTDLRNFVLDLHKMDVQDFGWNPRVPHIFLFFFFVFFSHRSIPRRGNPWKRVKSQSEGLTHGGVLLTFPIQRGTRVCSAF